MVAPDHYRQRQSSSPLELGNRFSARCATCLWHDISCLGAGLDLIAIRPRDRWECHRSEWRVAGSGDLPAGPPRPATTRSPALDRPAGPPLSLTPGAWPWASSRDQRTKEPKNEGTKERRSQRPLPCTLPYKNKEAPRWCRGAWLRGTAVCQPGCASGRQSRRWLRSRRSDHRLADRPPKRMRAPNRGAWWRRSTAPGTRR